ncbi:hypothetical protein AVEN_46635-1 [Araneus ventricosus]|uniref:GAG-pre-integrase domain-containing protein n=1 Tax=Araneus ventricosus TaxID=182803 RepID=A0A4Y2TLU2_ARAVE|nr:hypothetical protein AVEN_46635-1 [Araneus ventricosus]
MAMASYGAMRIELLTRDNYETWKIQMRALLVKNDLWTYVGGIKVKPELIDGNAELREACNVLRIKLIEERKARRHDSGAQSADSGAFTACHHKCKNASWNSKSKPQKEVDNKFKIKCVKCNKWGDHKAVQCKSQRQSTPGRKPEIAGLLTSTKWNNNTADALLAFNTEKRWCLDSGCTRHLSSDESIFVTLGETDVSEVKLANNGTTEVKGCGKAVIKAEVNNNIQTVDVNDSLFVPELRTNLLSVAKLCDRGYTVTFKNDVATLINAKAKVKLVADRKDNLYYLRGSDTNQSAKHASESLDTPKTKCADLVKWHCRLGHLNMKDLKESIKRSNIHGLNISKSPVKFDCEICAINKLTRAPFPKKSNRVTSLLEIVHSDLC